MSGGSWESFRKCEWKWDTYFHPWLPGIAFLENDHGINKLSHVFQILSLSLRKALHVKCSSLRPMSFFFRGNLERNHVIIPSREVIHGPANSIPGYPALALYRIVTHCLWFIHDLFQARRNECLNALGKKLKKKHGVDKGVSVLRLVRLWILNI